MAMRWAPVALAVVFAAALGIPAASAAPVPPGPQITDVTTHPGSVQFLLTVPGLAAGQSLDPSSVTVTVGGTVVPATATALASGSPVSDAPVREVLLAIDTSAQLTEAGLTAVKAAALSYASALPGDVRVGLLTFSTRPTMLLPPSRDRAALAAALQGVHASGGKALYDAVLSAVASMLALPTGTTGRVVLVSDGDDNASGHPLAAVAGVLAQAGVPVDAVAFGWVGDGGALGRDDLQVLNQIATAAGGTVLPVAAADGLAGQFAKEASGVSPPLQVTVQVPTSLAGKAAQLTATVRAGSQTLSSAAQVTLSAVKAGQPHGSAAVRAAPAASTSNLSLWLVCATVFVTLLGLALLGVFVPAAAQARSRTRSRLGEVNRYRVLGAYGGVPAPAPQAPRGANPFTTRALSVADKAVRARGNRRELVAVLDRAGLRIRPEEWAVLQGSIVVVTGAVVALLLHNVLGLLGGGVGWLACRGFLRLRTSRRMAAFADQLPNTLQLLAGSLRAGFSLDQSLSSVVREGTEPTASEFTRALAEVRLGAELVDALDAAAERMNCDDLHWVVLAVRISREVGGNLAEVLQNTVGTMRERNEVRGQVKVLSAEGRISAKILMGLPFLMAGYLLVFKPGYLNPLFSGIGLAVLALGVVLLVVGSFWLSRLVKIEV